MHTVLIKEKCINYYQLDDDGPTTSNKMHLINTFKVVLVYRYIYTHLYNIQIHKTSMSELFELLICMTVNASPSFFHINLYLL